MDVLVANLGAQKDAPIADMTLDDWPAVIDLDLTGQFLCCRRRSVGFVHRTRLCDLHVPLAPLCA